MGWFVPVDGLYDRSEEAGAERPEVKCLECGTGRVWGEGQDLCEDCAFLWMARKHDGATVH